MILLNKEKVKIFRYEDCEKIDSDLIEEKLEDIYSLIEEYEKEENYEYMECPNCKSDKLIRYGTYKRNIGIAGKYIEIKIKRVQCTECKQTHALIPSFMLPYYQNEVSFMEVIITLKEEKKEKTNKIVEKVLVTRQLINFWVRRFKRHLTRLKTIFTYEIKEIMIILFEGIKMRKKYQEINKIRFMQKLPT